MLISLISNLLRLSKEFLCSFWEWLNKSCITSLIIKECLVRTISLFRCKSEWILALSGDVEGETTAFYLYRQIDSLSKSLNLNVRVSTLARGLGFGDDLEYADTLTLGRSIAARQPFKP